jgi:serine/threonine protein kinase
LNRYSPFAVGEGSGVDVSWENGQLVFRRVWRRAADGQREAVLVVTPAAEHPTPAALDRLAHEYGLKDELDAAWAVRPLEIVRERGRTMLMLEDPGGEPLDRLLDAPVEVESYLRLAIGIAAALGKLHQRGLVHKDLKPAHVLVNCADGQVRLMGFGLSSRLHTFNRSGADNSREERGNEASPMVTGQGARVCFASLAMTPPVYESGRPYMLREVGTRMGRAQRGP